MTANEKRALAVKLIKSRAKCNTYTQGGNRKYVFGKPEGAKKGYGDCSSTVRAVLLKATGIDIGSNTSAQISKRANAIMVEDNRDGKRTFPTLSKLLPGDCVYYKGTPSHTWGVGHVEMVTGENICYGHGSGIGPTKKDLKAYSKNRTGSKKYLCVLRHIKGDSQEVTYKLGDRPLVQGTMGPDVKALQELLILLGNALEPDGADGEYGPITAKAVKTEQTKWGLAPTGDADIPTISMIVAKSVGDAQIQPIERVKIYGGNCYIRTGPSKEYPDVGVATNGAIFEGSGEYDDDGDFIGIIYKGKSRWVSAKYAEIIGRTELVTEDEFQAIDPEYPDVEDDPSAGEDSDGDGQSDREDIFNTDPKEVYVVVTTQKANVRKKPKSTAKLWKVVPKGTSYIYTGETKNGFRGVKNNGALGWINSKFSTLEKIEDSTDREPISTKPFVCIDLSQHNALKHAANDWEKLAKSVHFVILRCGVTRTNTNPIGIGKDDHFEYAVKQCIKYQIPFGVYYYGKKADPDACRKEAEKCWAIASPYNPLFYVYDVEEGVLTTKGIKAWVERIRELGAKKVAIYTIASYYAKHKSAMLHSGVDFIWGARFCGAKNKNGKFIQSAQININQMPEFPCDLWQYTSVGDVPGIKDETIDVNTLTGTKPLSYFLEVL